MNVLLLLKELMFLFLFAFTAAGVVQCGGRKTSPRISPLVQLYFSFGPLGAIIEYVRHSKVFF